MACEEITYIIKIRNILNMIKQRDAVLYMFMFCATAYEVQSS